MELKEKLGIWMDHAEAHLVAFSIDKNDIRIIRCDHESMDNSAERHSEKQANNKKRNIQDAFYKKIWSQVRDYEELLLFGPTDAKTEFFNQIRTSHANDGVKISLRNTGKMSHDEMRDFVYKHFKPIMLP